MTFRTEKRSAAIDTENPAPLPTVAGFRVIRELPTRGFNSRRLTHGASVCPPSGPDTERIHGDGGAASRRARVVRACRHASVLAQRHRRARSCGGPVRGDGVVVRRRCSNRAHTVEAALALFRTVEQFDAQCPVHADHGRSLLVTYVPAHSGRPGRVVVRCSAGCTAAEIRRALGLSAGDMFDAPSPAARPVRAVPGPGACMLCSPDAIDATFDRLYGGP